eukprot:5731834-Pyramimonas_sp.AAC.1
MAIASLEGLACPQPATAFLCGPPKGSPSTPPCWQHKYPETLDNLEPAGSLSHGWLLRGQGARLVRGVSICLLPAHDWLLRGQDAWGAQMSDDMEAHLLALGVPKEHVRLERWW